MEVSLGYLRGMLSIGRSSRTDGDGSEVLAGGGIARFSGRT